MAKADGEGVPTDGDLLGENGVDAVEECLAELKAGMNFWELGKHVFIENVNASQVWKRSIVQPDVTIEPRGFVTAKDIFVG